MGSLVVRASEKIRLVCWSCETFWEAWQLCRVLSRYVFRQLTSMSLLRSGKGSANRLPPFSLELPSWRRLAYMCEAAMSSWRMLGRLPVLHSTTKAWTVPFTDFVWFRVAEGTAGTVLSSLSHRAKAAKLVGATFHRPLWKPRNQNEQR